jgi:hypothetical protein
MKKQNLVALGIFVLAMAVAGAAWAQGKSADAGPITGTWDCSSHGGDQGDSKFSLTLEQDGEKVTGSVDSPQGGMDITSGTFKDNKLEIRLETPQGNYVLSAELKDGELSGNVTLDDKAQGTWEGKKEAAEKK